MFDLLISVRIVILCMPAVFPSIRNWLSRNFASYLVTCLVIAPAVCGTTPLSGGGGGVIFFNLITLLICTCLFSRRIEGRRSGTKMSGPTTFKWKTEHPNPQAATTFEHEPFAKPSSSLQRRVLWFDLLPIGSTGL